MVLICWTRKQGLYNDSYIRQYLAGHSVNVMSWVGRIQGLLVQKGNPKKIMTLDDLIRPDVEFANRQRGAGTRVLLDYQLKLSGIHEFEHSWVSK